jgi:hypothetical protein
MKKILLVLMVLTLASFLLVGCFGVPDGTEGEGEGEVEVEVTIAVENEYTNVGGVTYVPCADKVTITFPEPVDPDYVVYVARKILEGDGTVTYKGVPDPEPVAAIPNADRTVWTVEEYEFLYGYLCEGVRAEQPNGFVCECEPICLVALVKHPCCPGEEAALRVVTVDCYPPELDLFVKFTDCDDPCTEDDPCAPAFAGVSMEWTSRATGACETTDCCEDDCSGVNGWSLVIDPDPCLGPCDTADGIGCPVEGAIECECFAYADSGETICYEIDFSIEDNVGNAVTSTWELCLDTDSIVSFKRGETLLDAVDDWYQIYGNCTPIPI